MRKAQSANIKDQKQVQKGRRALFSQAQKSNPIKAFNFALSFAL